MDDELAKLDSLRQQGILTEEAYWDARSRLLTGSPGYVPAPVYPPSPNPALGVGSLPTESWSARHQRPTRRRGRLVALLVTTVLVLLGAGVGSYFLWFRETTTTVNATLVLVDSATARANCVGQGSNTAVAAGAEVRLLDGDDRQVGHGTLSQGSEDGDRCTFRVRIAAVSDELSTYSLSVDGFPRQTMTRSELEAANWTFSARKDAPVGPVSGTLDLSDVDTALNDCEGTGGYDDIHEGAEVVIRDQDSRILGSGYLDAGNTSDYSTCSFPFTVEGVRLDQEQYTVEISHRGEITASRNELASNDWEFSLTLGS